MQNRGGGGELFTCASGPAPSVRGGSSKNMGGREVGEIHMSVLRDGGQGEHGALACGVYNINRKDILYG